MKDLKIKQLYPYIGVVLFFLILSLGYFYPQIQGKVLASHDNKQWKGGAKEIIDFREATGGGAALVKLHVRRNARLLRICALPV